MDQTIEITNPVRRWRKRLSNEKISLRPSARGDSSTPNVSSGKKKSQKLQKEEDNQSEKGKSGSILDERIRDEIDRLSDDDSDFDCDTDMEHIWTVIRKKGPCWPHVTESEFHEVGDNVRRDLWTFIRDHPNVPMPVVKVANLGQKFAKFTLTMVTKKAHVAYSIWAQLIEILFWLCYYLCFSWKFAIVNTHKGLLKSDEWVTWLYDDREINLLHTQVDPDPDSDTEKRE